MHSTLYKANKLLMIEKKNKAILSAGLLPEEYRKIRIPSASYYLRQDDECDILSQHIAAGPFSLWLHDIFTKEDVMLLPYTPYHIWTLHYMFEDTLQAEKDNKSDFCLEEKECNLFNLQPGIHKVPMARNKKVLSVHININPENFPALTKKHPSLFTLLDNRDPDKSRSINVLPHHINPVADFLIQKILSCQYTGNRAYYLVRRCCLDLLLNFSQQDANQPFLFSSILHMDKFTQLFSYLLNNPHKSYSIHELAYMFYQTPEQLLTGFQQHYSVSIEMFMYMLRMMTTYNLLHKGHLSIEAIAETLNFSSAKVMVDQIEDYYDCKMDQMRH